MKGKNTAVISRRKKRLGRGYGSGKGGHTVGKGQKGQKTRKKLGILFEGVKVKKSLVKRLPFLRGKGKFSKRSENIPVNLNKLESFPSGTKVDLNYLVKAGVVAEKEARSRGVKILGNTKINKKLTIVLPISKGASEIILKAGGKVLKKE